MAAIFQSLFGGSQSGASSATVGDDAFADFATAVSPAAPSHAASSASTFAQPTGQPAAGGLAGLFKLAAPTAFEGRPYTKWYRVWERVTLADFYQELVIIPLMLVVVLINVWGSWANKKRAKQWAKAHLPALESEYASVGFDARKRSGSVSAGNSSAKDLAGSGKLGEVPDDMLRQKAKNEYITYATGRANVAFLDVKISLHKRYNPAVWLFDSALAFFMDGYEAPVERLEATAMCFDGKEKALLPQSAGTGNSTFDGFVWAIVHKDKMKQLRNDRYDLSLTATRDHPKLPDWATIMTESAEISDALMTPELIKAVTDAGEDFESFIISDQPVDAPKKLNDTLPKKRVSLSMKLNSSASPSSLFSYFLRMPDQLVSAAHFRAEALRKVKATREDEMRKIRKLDEEEKADERRLAGDKMKKEERDRRLTKMSAEEQRKFLEKEKETERKKANKKRTMRA